MMEAICCYVLGVLAVVRAPGIHRSRARLLSWLALVSGSAAIFMTGAVVPLAVVDGWFGGTNVVNLAQNVLATIAVWCMARSTQALRDHSSGRLNVLPLVVAIVAFSVPFLLMDRGSTSSDFIRENSADGWLWAYASIYMAYLAVVMIQLLAGIRGRTSWEYKPIRAGAVLMIVASLFEIVYLFLSVIGGGRWEWARGLGYWFELPFYTGILLVGVGLGGFALIVRTRVVALMTVRTLVAGHGYRASDAGAPASEYDWYRLAVLVTDLAHTGMLNRRERYVLALSSRVLNWHRPWPKTLQYAQTGLTA